jgi:hypothetical protein
MPNDSRLFYEKAYVTPIELASIGTTVQKLFPGQPSKYWTDIKIQIETMGTNSAIYMGDQNTQIDLIGSQAGQYFTYSTLPGEVINVARFYIRGDSAGNDGKVFIVGLDPQITPDQVINPFQRV